LRSTPQFRNFFFREIDMRRYLYLLALVFPIITACATNRGIPEPATRFVSVDAQRLLIESAEAHGLQAWQEIKDISVSYSGEWASLVTRLQPVLIDASYRQRSQERLILSPSVIVSQLHTGPGGEKLVIRESNEIRIRYNGTVNEMPAPLAAAALVADGYRMFLTGPFYFLAGNQSLSLLPEETVDAQPCHVLLAVRRPGHGLSVEDRYLIYINKQSMLVTRIRFTMEGLESTRGAVAEVDMAGHISMDGVRWPTHFIERLIKPIPNLAVHQWQLTGLDLNRGLRAEDINGDTFSTLASSPAKELRVND
jgi:hypothetical protein